MQNSQPAGRGRVRERIGNPSMTFTTGFRLGPYELAAPIGAGGMGEVWRAKDSRLGRDVAVKILPPSFAENPDMKARFEREARTISSLNHPNICTLFDVGQHDGTNFLVMELLEGETLADRIEKGPLPVEQVLRSPCALSGPRSPGSTIGFRRTALSALSGVRSPRSPGSELQSRLGPIHTRSLPSSRTGPRL